MPVKYDVKRVIRPGTKHEWTEQMVKEYAASARSVKYFAIHHCKVVHPVDGLMSLQLRDYQMRMLDAVDQNRLTVLNCPRQVGKSTILGLFCLWFAMFSEEPVEIWILANKGRTAQSLLDDIKGTYEELEPFLKLGIVEYNKTGIEFENGSRIQTGTTSRDTIRGESVSFLVLDEFAHVPAHIADDFYTGILPTISTGGKLCIISTPNGNNGKFYELFSEAKSNPNSDFGCFDMQWDEVPGRDEEFKRRQIEASSLQEWNQEFEAKFLGSSKTLVSPDALEAMLKIIQEPNFRYEHFNVWEKPRKNQLYVVSVDVAKGVFQDSSVIQVLNVTDPGLAKQAAVWSYNGIDPFDFTEKVNEIGLMYNKAFVIVENNTYGHEVARRLFDDFQYENLYKENKKSHFGISSTSKSKDIGSSLLKKYIEDKKLLVFDKMTYDEVCKFIEATPGVYKAAKGRGNHDDTVMALMWGVYFIETDYWKEWADYLRNQENINNDSMEELEEIYDPVLCEDIQNENILDEDFDDSWLM